MEYRCNKCNKQYSSYQSLWIHNKKYHQPIVIKKDDNKKIPSSKKDDIVIIPIANNNNPNTILVCKYCKKTLSSRQSRWRHENNCKVKTYIIHEQNKIQTEIDNKKIINNTTYNINQGTINNTTNIIKFGSEDIHAILNKSQIMQILNCRLLALEESIKMIHFNDSLPQYQNIKINNLRSNIALVYDGNTFNAVNQYNAINDLISNHVDIITQLIDENQNKITERTLDKLNQFIDKINDNYHKIFDNDTNRTFKNYKEFKINQVKNIIYNECSKIKNKKLII